ncbi:hypothetical protein PVK06_031468 [Gossypium arboreum]|uniref:Uncharacterized protein n=1 Tax=Gossypium arboreum TaxID=29729 RepID=A0ABR0NR40_GOSAR|nr:hypothetical protein PVK06_031468 [Gossypium arboreum]
MEISLFEKPGFDKSIMKELIPRKVRFRDKDGESNDGMKVDSPSAHPNLLERYARWPCEQNLQHVESFSTFANDGY